MIYIVINSLGKGGAERSVLELLAELVRLRVPARVLTLYAMSGEYPIDPALAAHVTRLGARSFVLALWRLFRRLRRVPGDRVFSLMPQSNLAAIVVGRLRGLPVVTSERTTPRLFYRPLPKMYAALLPHALADRSVFISRYALDNGLPDNAFGRRIRSRAQVLHNPVSCPVPLPEALQQRRARLRRLRAQPQDAAGAADGPLTLLLASRLVAGKGILEFLESAHDTLRKRHWQLVIAGEGPLRAEIEGLSARHGLQGRIELRGFVADIHAAYAQADVVVLTSFSEGFGRVGFEAYQAGCLVLGTMQNSFAAEVIPDAPAWHVVPDNQALAAALVPSTFASAPDDGSDIAAMRAALGIEAHTARFLSLCMEGLHRD